MNLDGLEAIIELIEMGAMSSNRDIAKCLRSAVAVLKEQEQKREWVGLTDEEKSDLWCKSTGQNCVNEDTHPSAQIMNLVIRQQGFNFAKAIEAKLKEKNT